MATSQTEGFAALYERTFPRVYAYVASLLRDRAAAEDVTSQAFERAYRKRRSYRPGRGFDGRLAIRDRTQRRPEDGDDGGAGGAGSFDDALGDAGELLVGTAGVLVRILAVALPLGLIALLAWVIAAVLRRRRRESVLA